MLEQDTAWLCRHSQRARNWIEAVSAEEPASTPLAAAVVLAKRKPGLWAKVVRDAAEASTALRLDSLRLCAWRQQINHVLVVMG
eukprot:11166651-Lingulodinium_polyedra.AAC.1